MATSTPTLEAVLAAIKTAVLSVASVGTVKSSDHPFEDDLEWLEQQSLLDLPSWDAWIVELRGVSEAEGAAAGEVYDIYSIGIRHWSSRTDNADWSQEARELSEAVREAISGNEDVFRIGGQVQLFTPETVSFDSHEKVNIRGTEGDQMVFRSVLSLAVEARRWA